MRHLLPAAETLRLHTARLREPLVQVWLMAGMSVVLVTIGHVHALRQSDDGKNLDSRSTVRLLSAGPRIQWTDDFAPNTPQQLRPALQLGTPSTPPPVPGAELSGAFRELDWRAEMAAAASRPWSHLGKEQRKSIAAQSPDFPEGQALRLRWSGNSRGNAAQLSLSWQRLGQAEPFAFVIGNGSRSEDGGIEITGALDPSAPLRITLIGTAESVTEKQKQALGELLNFLEARFGPLDGGA